MKKATFLYLVVVCTLLSVLVACAAPTSIAPMAEAPSDSLTQDTYWRSKLSPEQYYILRQKGTEKPFSGKFLFHQEKGNYTCAACGNILFSSNAKFESHCGWPSFDEQIAAKNILTKEDHSHGMDRIEIVCGKCGGHLGHLFDDGPTETGKRYCVNSLALSFAPLASKSEEQSVFDTIVLGGGCYWCIETIFLDLKGVVSVESGYSGGKIKKPTYEMVCTGNTGHAEVVQIIYDKNMISLAEILKVFFSVHDPTTLNKQGADEGTQYRSAIFYRNEMQKNSALQIIRQLEDGKVFEQPIVTEVTPFSFFVKAEQYHQNYYNRNANAPYCRLVIQPKKEKFEKAFKELLKNK